MRPLIFLYFLCSCPLTRTGYAENIQKSLTKQGLKFKLSTKVLSAEKKDGRVIVTTEAAKDGKQETVRGSQIPHLLAGS